MNDLMHSINETELERRIQSTTHRQVEDLKIDCSGSRVTVTGLSRSYYVKQLATQAVLSIAPRARLVNDIHVCAG